MRQAEPVPAVVRLSSETLTQPRAWCVTRALSPPGSGPWSLPRRQSQLVLPAVDGPFHFTHHLFELCRDICLQLDEFRHIDMSRVLVTYVRSRNALRWGLQAKLVPLRFSAGASTCQRRGREYRMQQLYIGDAELKYVLSFYLPRFLNQTFDEKFITIVHELYHISPRFDGDVRRFPGGSVHTRSMKQFDRHMAGLARKYLQTQPPREYYEFLRLSFAEIEAKFGEVVGVNIPSPKLIPV